MSKRQRKVTAQNQQCITWEDALQGFLFWKKAQGISKTTYDDYKRHVTYFFNRYPIGLLNATLKQSAIEYLSDDIKPATYNLRLIYLKAFFQWCVNEGYISTNPLAGLKARKTQSRIVNVNEDILQKLLSLPDKSTYAGLRDYVLLMFTLDTGLRPKEAMSLKLNDFDLKNCMVTVPAEEAKTRVTRSVPILPPTAKAINSLISSRHSEWSTDIPVFCSSEGTHLVRSSWRTRLNNYSDELGVKIRPYDLRHVFALLYLRNGGHAFGLQKTLGHTDMSMTRKYVNLTGQDLQDVHQKASPLQNILKRNARVNKLTR